MAEKLVAIPSLLRHSGTLPQPARSRRLSVFMLGLYRFNRYNPSMKSGNALRVRREITVHQWGMVTSAQSAIHGITRLTLSRLTEAGHLERLAHGVYKVSGTPSDQFEDLRIAWLSTEPKATGESRLQEREAGVVVAGASARSEERRVGKECRWQRWRTREHEKCE